jgi:hypothetical protein
VRLVTANAKIFTEVRNLPARAGRFDGGPERVAGRSALLKAGRLEIVTAEFEER